MIWQPRSVCTKFGMDRDNGCGDMGRAKSVGKIHDVGRVIFKIDFKCEVHTVAYFPTGFNVPPCKSIVYKK